MARGFDSSAEKVSARAAKIECEDAKSVLPLSVQLPGLFELITEALRLRYALRLFTGTSAPR